jgi:DnaK suppressor protein
MDLDRARALLAEERTRVEALIADARAAGDADRAADDDPGDFADNAQPLTSSLVDDAIADGLRDRLAAIDRAERRLEDGTYGLSVRSGEPIPDERLEADPAAELTVEEQRREENG